jgi:hypothetical protein
MFHRLFNGVALVGGCAQQALQRILTRLRIGKDGEAPVRTDCAVGIGKFSRHNIPRVVVAPIAITAHFEGAADLGV